MVLNDVTKRARLFVGCSAPLHAEGLRDGDLHVVDCFAVPGSFEQGVAESEHQNVLDGLLAQIVVDSVDLRLAERPVDRFVQFLRRCHVMAERLFQHQPCARHQPGVFQPGDDRRHGRGWHREVDEPFGFAGLLRQARVTVVAQPYECQPLLELRPRALVEAGTRKLADGLPRETAEAVGVQVAAAAADHFAALGQQAGGSQVVDRRQQLPAREITGGADDDDVLRRGGFQTHDGLTACPPNSLRSAATTFIAKASS